MFGAELVVMRSRAAICLGAATAVATLSLAGPASAASPHVIIGEGGCTLNVTGSPGYVSFTAHATNTCPHTRVRAYCKYFNVDTGYGNALAEGVSGTSVARCSGISEYGYQAGYNGQSWQTHRLG